MLKWRKTSSSNNDSNCNGTKRNNSSSEGSITRASAIAVLGVSVVEGGSDSAADHRNANESLPDVTT